GGVYRLVMRSPEGVDHALQGVYMEVVAPERLVFTHVWLDRNGKPGKETLVTITFRSIGNKTELTLHQIGLDSAASRDGHRGGWNSTFDRLAGYLSDVDSNATSRTEA
ncbi:MAG TPA: SRPBCC domain-containing protein, partial [Gemmatimonadaceae bacterium]